MKALYLKNLNLLNFATFENQQVLFDPGFNAIIGETGSGKSLILDALELILGSRAEKKLVRKDCEFASVEAIFESNSNEIKNYLADLGFPSEGNEILIKRLIYKDGISKTYLNFQACSIATLSNFSKRFVDLVGQFENQKLLSETYQLQLIDQYAGLSDLVKNYQEHFNTHQETKKLIEEALTHQNLRVQRMDYLNFQKEEIEKLNPSIDDETTLINKKFIFQNKEQKETTVNNLLSLLGENGDGPDISSLLRQAKSIAERGQKVIPVNILEKINECLLSIEEISYELNKSLDLGDDDINIEEILEKLDLYQKLKKKFGPQVEDILRSYQSIITELESLNDHDKSISNLHKQLEKSLFECNRLGKQLHEKRTMAATLLGQELTSVIRSLKMNGATIRIQTVLLEELATNGLTQLKFEAETNPGEGFFKVKDIASGGELSRILLAIRQILSAKDTISVFLFDEIDTGMGGETALCIGKALRNVAYHSQVIAITHLPQIAHHAEKLVIVSKTSLQSDKEKRTISVIREITGKAREQEILNMTPLT